MFKCEQCPSVFIRKDNLVRHEKIHDGVRFTCTICALSFSVMSNLKRHEKNTHGIVQAHRQPAPVVAQPTRQSVIQFAPRVAPQGDIQIPPQIFIPDIPAGGSNMVSEDEICMAAMEEFEKVQDDNTG
ncbi:zinc finger protein 668-like [Rhopalosiphum maidis]|uniref:zinc finger protein 668-like n=1 Tax=Rhopalosiphum maidis TaxID=43146 RepID=UPI000F00B51F|nr:zinc finger protein 668-like [Rhopalosiphum maidis]